MEHTSSIVSHNNNDSFNILLLLLICDLFRGYDFDKNRGLWKENCSEKFNMCSASFLSTNWSFTTIDHQQNILFY